MPQQESIGKWVSAIYRYSQMHINKELSQYNIGSGQYLPLIVLINNEGINQEALAKMLHLDKATVARAISKLIEKGLVTRKVDPTDHRAYLLYITRKGKKMVTEIRKVLAHTSTILLSGFSSQDKKMALNLLRKMYQNMTTLDLK